MVEASPLNALTCQGPETTTRIEPSVASLNSEGQALSEDLTNQIIAKIGMKLSLPNIVSDVRGFALRPDIMRGAMRRLTERNAKEKFLSPCQLDLLLSSLRRAIVEARVQIPPVFSNGASLLVNQNGYTPNVPLVLIVVLTPSEALGKTALPEFEVLIADGQGKSFRYREPGNARGHYTVHTETMLGIRKAFVRLILPSLPTGKYTVSLEVRGNVQTRLDIDVQPQVLGKALSLAKTFFKVQRAHDPAKAFHGGVYPDDPVNVGGHLDAGDNNIYLYTEAPAMFSLVKAFEVSLDRAFLEEAEYGARFLAGLVRSDGTMWSAVFNGYPPNSPSTETDGVPGTGDERPLKEDLWGDSKWAAAIAAALFAKCAYYKVGNFKDYSAKARLVGDRLMGEYAGFSAHDFPSGDLGNNLQGIGALISFNLTLYQITGDTKYLKGAASLFTKFHRVNDAGNFSQNGKLAFQDYVPTLFVESLYELYEFYMTHGTLIHSEKGDYYLVVGERVQPEDIKDLIVKYADHYLNNSDPIYQRSRFEVDTPSGGRMVTGAVPLQSWMTGTHRGANSYILATSDLFSIAYKLSGREEFAQAARNQMNWIFGMNPFEISMVTGIGYNPVQYHARLKYDPIYRTRMPAFAPGGGVPGGIVNGIGERWGNPYFDLNPFPNEPPSWQTTEVWIPHVAWFALAATRLEATRP